MAQLQISPQLRQLLGRLRTRAEQLAVITQLTLVAQMYGQDLPAAPRDLQKKWEEERSRRFASLEERSHQPGTAETTPPLLAQTVGTVPPSMTYSAPTMAEARSDTRNPTRSAISSGWANRPRGTPPRES